MGTGLDTSAVMDKDTNTQRTDTPGADWRSQIPENLRNEKPIQEIKDIGTLAKAYVDAQKYIGGALKLPGQDAGQEEWDKVYDKLGRPKSPEEYKFDRGQPPEGMTYDEGLEKSFGARAHSIGLNRKQAQALMDWYNEQLGAVFSKSKETIEKGLDALETDWGHAFDTNVGIANRALQKFANPEVAMLLKETGLADHPAVLRLFYTIGKAMANDVSPKGEGTTESTDKDRAKARIQEINNDRNHPYWQRYHQGHEAAVQEMNKLQKIVYGS